MTHSNRPGSATMLGQILSVRRERRALGRLPDDLLSDVGLDPDSARREARRPFWNLPRR